MPVVVAGWLMPRSQHITCEATSGTLAVALQADGSRWDFEFHRIGSDWHTVGAIPLPVVGRAGTTLTLLRREAVATDEFDDLLREGTADDPATIGGLQRALDLLGRHAAAYAEWILRGVRSLLVVPGDDRRLRSGSMADIYALCYLSSCTNPLAYAESLVHEASHLHFHVASWLGPVHDGTDRRLHYSAAVGRERPIDRILLAYHAFANVLLMYRQLRGAGVDVDGYGRRAETDMVDLVRQLDVPLRTTRALTAVGRSLYEPLRERVS